MGLLTLLNTIATLLTIETGVLSNKHEVTDARLTRDIETLSCKVDYENVSQYMEPYFSATDDYISKYYYRIKENILSYDERKQFVNKYYETHPDHRMEKQKLDNLLNGFLDDFEAILREKMTIGEKISYRKMVEILKTNQEIAQQVQETLVKTREIDVTTCENLKISRDNNRILRALSTMKELAPSNTVERGTNANIELQNFLLIRQLADNLFVNWKTGCLALDFQSALAGRDGAGNDLPKLNPVQIRLLSVLVQGEGAVVSWKDIFWRGKLLSKWEEKYAIPEYVVTEQNEIVFQKTQRKPKQNEIQEIAEEVIEELNDAIKKITNNYPKPSGIKKKLSANRGVINDGLEKNQCEANELGHSITSDAKDNIEKKFIKKAHNGKGYRIELVRDNRGDLFSGYERYIDEDKLKKNDYKLLRTELKDKQLSCCREVSAWLRRYYCETCSFFENRVSNRGSSDVDSGDQEIFGDYKMVQAYLIPYAVIGKDRLKNNLESMLDYVERWHSERKELGRLLILHGQPGDGKSTFCKKAVYAHCKEGWLPNTRHVLQFSLNPADSRILGDEGIDIDKAFCIRKYNNHSYPLDLEEAEDALFGSLVILDGYDELAGSLDAAGYKFKDFCREAKIFAGNNKCNVIITSRTMCIKADLEGRMLANTSVALFAPLDEEQQDALIDRMIELDTLKTLDYYGTAKDSVKQTKEKKKTLQEYRDDLNRLRWDNDEKFKDFKELLKVPILFRMIVHIKFDQFEGIRSVADLYGKLFYLLLDQKDRSGEYKIDKEQLVTEYENLAIRIFNYDRDTCPFFTKETGEKGADKKELIYYFYTKWGDDGKGYLGFLHASFYQYFLARYIVSSVRKLDEWIIGEKKNTEEGSHQFIKESPAFEKLFVSLSAEKLVDPDMWKLVTQLARIDQTRYDRENEYLLFHEHRDRIQKKHVKNILKCLNEGDPFSRKMLAEDPFERKEDKNHRCLYERMENAVFNLISTCAAIEDGCIEDYSLKGVRQKRIDDKEDAGVDSDVKNNVIEYSEYPNISGLLKFGNYSRIYLKGINLDSCNLKNARLAGAHFTRVKMNRAELAGVDLSGASLEGAELNYAKLEGANLKGALLKKARMKGVDLNQANLERAVLEDAVLESAHLEEANLESANLENACLSGASFRGAYLKEASLLGAVLDEKAFENMNDANLRGTILH